MNWTPTPNLMDVHRRKGNEMQSNKEVLIQITFLFKQRAFQDYFLVDCSVVCMTNQSQVPLREICVLILFDNE